MGTDSGQAAGSPSEPAAVGWAGSVRQFGRLLLRVGDAVRASHVAMAIGVAAIGLRLFRRAETWPSSDAADLAAFVNRFVCGDGGFFEDVSEVALYKLGGVQSNVVYLHMLLFKWLGVQVTELTWEATTILVSAASCFAAYLFIAELAGASAGIIAAAMVAVCPMGINLGRHLGAPWAYEECLQWLICFLAVALMRRPAPAVRAGFNVAVAVYFWAGNQMLAIFPVVGFAFLSGFLEEGGRKAPLRFLRERFFTLWMLVPAASMAALLHRAIVQRHGHLAHALYDKRKPLGFWMDEWFNDAFYNVGQLVTCFSIAAVLLGLVQERRVFSLRRLPVVLFVCYAAPFWFFVNKTSTLTRGYSMYGIFALLLAAAAALHHPNLRQARAPLLAWASVVLLLSGSTRSSYAIFAHPIQSTRAFQGTYAPTNGAKAAAYYIRSRGKPKGRVFSDASGGSGLEPPLMSLYFARSFFALFDASRADAPYKKYRSRAGEIEYLVIDPAHRSLAQRHFPDFSEALRVTDGDRGELLLVYDRGQRTAPPEEMDAHEGGRAFASKYTLLCPVKGS